MVTGAEDAALDKLIILTNESASDDSPAQMTLQHRAARELESLEQGRVHGVSDREVGVLSADSFSWLVELRLKEIESLDTLIAVWKSERSRYTLAYAQMERLDLGLEGVSSQVDSSILAVKDGMSEMFTRAVRSAPLTSGDRL